MLFASCIRYGLHKKRDLLEKSKSKMSAYII